MKLFYFDTETTGVRYWKNSIHQISGIIEIDGKVEQKFDFNVKPYHNAIVESQALEVSGVTRAQVMGYPEQKSVYKKIIKMLEVYVDKFDKTDKFFLVGYNNAHFDNPFFRAMFVQCEDNYFGSWFWSSAIDVMVLAAKKLMDVRHTMVNFKLVTVAKQLGVEVDESKLHDAGYDVYLTREIYLKL